MIQWFSKNNKTMMATIYKSNITINKPGLDKINTAYAALVGLDESTSSIAIKPLSKDEYDLNIYPKDCMFILSGGKTYTRISSTEFVSSLSSTLGISFQKSKKYMCRYDEKEKLLFIDLTKGVN